IMPFRSAAITARIVVIAALALGAGVPSAAPAQQPDLLVFAAASLKNALDEINAKFQRDTGTKATTAYAASSALARQIPASVPAGKYAKASLEALGVWASVAAKLAPAENVRAALLLVSRGEAPLGIVYETDAAVDPGVRVVDRFPPDSHPPIVYPIAVTR